MRKLDVRHEQTTMRVVTLNLVNGLSSVRQRAVGTVSYNGNSPVSHIRQRNMQHTQQRNKTGTKFKQIILTALYTPETEDCLII